MSERSSFFAYSSGDRHLLLHAKEPRWLVVNRTGLEIARYLDRGESIDQVAGRLVAQYGIAVAAAKHDVLSVSEQLARQRFLNAKTIRPAGRSPSLNGLYLHLTGRCNLSCPHCYLSCPDALTPEELPTSRVLRLIDELAAQGGQSVTLSGGEPLLHPGIRTILEYAAPKLRIRLLTHGLLIDREWASFLSGMDLSIQVSLDGSRKEVHDAIRGEGNFDRLLRTVETLQEAGLGNRIEFSVTIMKPNVHDLIGILFLAQRLQVPRVRFLPLRRVGTAQRRWRAIGSGIGVPEYERFYRNLADWQAHGGCSVQVSSGLSGFLLQMPAELSGDDLWCPVGKRLVVATNGDAYPCVLMMSDPFRLGNVFHDSLSGMIRSARMAFVAKALSDRRVQIRQCAPCPWRNLCQAGCMGQALDHRGSLWETDDFCDYRKRAYPEAFDKILKRASAPRNPPSVPLIKLKT